MLTAFGIRLSSILTTIRTIRGSHLQLMWSTWTIKVLTLPVVFQRNTRNAKEYSACPLAPWRPKGWLRTHQEASDVPIGVTTCSGKSLSFYGHLHVGRILMSTLLFQSSGQSLCLPPHAVFPLSTSLSQESQNKIMTVCKLLLPTGNEFRSQGETRPQGSHLLHLCVIWLGFPR